MSIYPQRMALPSQTVALLRVARELVDELPADAVLLLAEVDLDWDAVLDHLQGSKLLVVAQGRELTRKLKAYPELDVLDVDAGPTPTPELLSLAILEAVATERLRHGAHLIALYNGIDTE